MRLRSLSLVVVLLGTAATSFAQSPVPIRFGDSQSSVLNEMKEIEAFHTDLMSGPSSGTPRGENLDKGISNRIDNTVGKNSAIGKAASDLNSIHSANTAIGGAINSAFAFRDMFDRAATASSLLDSVIDGTLEPDVDSYTRGSPDTPTSLCGDRSARSAGCEQCFTAAGESLTRARYNLEKLRVAGVSTREYVSSRLALGDGLSGLTGLAALEWQRQRSGINKQFDKFKGTYDSKYEEMMKGLQNALARFDACESQFGEADWYNRFGFLYVQFMADKYKRNF